MKRRKPDNRESHGACGSFERLTPQGTGGKCNRSSFHISELRGYFPVAHGEHVHAAEVPRLSVAHLVIHPPCDFLEARVFTGDGKQELPGSWQTRRTPTDLQNAVRKDNLDGSTKAWRRAVSGCCQCAPALSAGRAKILGCWPGVIGAWAYQFARRILLDCVGHPADYPAQREEH